MSSPLSFPSQPHGYYSNFTPSPDALPDSAQETLHQLIQHLQTVLHLTQSSLGSTEELASALGHFDPLRTEFLSQINKMPNRGFEKKIKDQFESHYHHFLEDLNEIVDDQGHSLRDILYDPEQTYSFFEQLNRSSQKGHCLQLLSQGVEKLALNLKKPLY